MTVKFKKTAEQEASGLDKKDLVGAHIAIQVTGYRTDAPTSYGPSPRVDGKVWVLDGELAGTFDADTAFFGNLGKQIGTDAEVGDYRLGKVVQGKSANGRDWYGFEDATEDAEIVRLATEAIKGGEASGKASAPASVEDAPF